MSTTVSDFLVKGLKEWGIRRTFGFLGDGINEIIGPSAVPQVLAPSATAFFGPRSDCSGKFCPGLVSRPRDCPSIVPGSTLI
jgi:hypothetical protein